MVISQTFMSKFAQPLNSNSNFSQKIYENSPSTQQKSCVYTFAHSDCGSPPPHRSSIGVPGSIAARFCSTDCAPANSEILQSGGF
jgi:hypothetical protein